MQKKIGQIADAFEHLRFDQTISLIEQTLKKNAKSKNNQLNSVELRIIQCFRVGALTSLGKYHQAQPHLKQLSQKQSIQIMGKENPFLLVSICEMFCQQRERVMLQLLQKEFPTFDAAQTHRFYLSSYLFSPLAKLFLKEFVTSKNPVLQLGQIYMDYLQQLHQLGLIQYKRDGLYQPKEPLKASLKLVNMFLDKFVKSSEQQLKTLQGDLAQAVAKGGLTDQALSEKVKGSRKLLFRSRELKLKILIHQGAAIKAISLYHQIRSQVKFPFKFIRSILQLRHISQEKAALVQFYLDEMSNVFRNNLDFKTYTPLYDHYNQFLLFLLAQCKQTTVDLGQIRLREELLPQQNIYKFVFGSFPSILDCYYNSLNSQYMRLIDTSSTLYKANIKADYYRICIKGLLLQLLEVSQALVRPETIIKYLGQYTRHFSETLTYCTELKKWWPLLMQHRILENPTQITTQRQLILQINFRKINLAIDHPDFTLKAAQKMIQETEQHYHKRVKQVEQNRNLQKGERYISDQLLVIATDFVRACLELQQESGQQQLVICRLVHILQTALQRSPYNADLKMRLMHLLCILNHYERLFEVYLSNDIKSVQMQTLGYWYLRGALQMGTGMEQDQFMGRMIKSYHQNQRQTSQYALKSIKNGQLQRVQEYLSYRSNILNSYNNLLIQLMLYRKYRFDHNSQYYLTTIHQQLNLFIAKQCTLSFNADFKVLANQLYPQFSYGELYGLYNSWLLLHRQVSISIHQQLLVADLLGKQNQQLSVGLTQLTQIEQGVSKTKVQDLFDFSNYAFQQQILNFDCKLASSTLKRQQVLLQNWKNISSLRIKVIILTRFLANAIKTQQIEEGVQKLREDIFQTAKRMLTFYGQCQYRQQIRAVVMVRQGMLESYALLNLVRQCLHASKKLKAIAAVLSESVNKCLQLLLSQLGRLGWRQRIATDFKIVDQRDAMLERGLAMEAVQLKRILSRYQQLYK